MTKDKAAIGVAKRPAAGAVPSEKPADVEWDKLSQREKFIQTARELGCDESGEKLDEALRALGKARHR